MVTRTEAINEEVVAVVLPKNLYLAGSVAETHAVEEQQKLDTWPK